MIGNPTSGSNKLWLNSGKIDVDEVLQVAEAVQQADEPLNLEDLQEATDLSRSKLTKAVSRLQEVEAVKIYPLEKLVPVKLKLTKLLPYKQPP